MRGRNSTPDRLICQRENREGIFATTKSRSQRSHAERLTLSGNRYVMRSSSFSLSYIYDYSRLDGEKHPRST